MKKIYSQCLTVFYFFLILVIGVNEVNAQVIKPFKERTSSYSPAKTIYKIKGDFTMIGNTNLTLQNYAVDKTNGSNAMVYVDKDNNNQTHNSSAATLDLLNDSGAKLTNCYNIVYAGLYWTGRVSDALVSPNSFTVTKNGVTKTLDKRKILFKGPTSNNYNEFTATDIYFPTNADNNIYTAYAEVTDYVRNNGVGEYFAANIAATEGADGGDIGKFAGWGLVVVYENSAMKNRDITIFDGHAFVSNNIIANYTIPVSGFNSVTSGPVGIKLGVMAGEGDVNYAGDNFTIQKLNTNEYLELRTPANDYTNFFNSSIYTGGNNRNPNLVNNSGIDISMFYLPNENKDIIGNNQTSTSFKYGSRVDSYAIFSIVMAVDAYVPEIEGVLSATTINGSNAGAGPYTVLPGQELGYKVQIKNKGTEAIQNGKLVIPIPYNATFVSGSLAKTINFSPLPTPNSLTYEPTIGANGSIVWDIGTLPLPTNPDTVLAELSFKLKSTENCALLKNSNCNNSIQVNGVLSGKGANSTVTVADKSLILGYTNSGNCTGTSISAPLQTTIDSANYTNANCQATPPTIAFTFCNNSMTSIPVTDVIGSFPTGSTFYNAYPIAAGTTTQYTINNPFPATVGTSTYYAIPPGGANSGCYFQFTITVESITTMPTVNSPVNYCIGDTAVALTAIPSKPEYTLYYYQTATSTAQQSITPSTTTVGQFTYYVAEGKTNACIGPKKEIVVNVNSKPTLTITNPLPICALATSLDLSAASITAGSTTGLTYTYWTDATATTSFSNFNAAVPGTYYIKATNSSNCFDIKPVVVTKSTITITELTASHIDVKCFNQSTGSITVNNASGGVAPYTYSWKKNGTTYEGTSQTLNNLGFGNYEVTATDANGCQGTLTITISQPTAALALTDSSKTDVSCFGASTGSVTAGTVSNAVGTVIYSWKNSANVEVGTTATVSNLPAGTYILTVTDSCSSQSNTVTISQPGAALTLTDSSKTDVSCFGASTGSVTAGTVSNAVGTVNYSWKNSANVEVGTTATVSNLAAGTYTLTVKDSCSSQSNSVIVIQPTTVLSCSVTQNKAVTSNGLSNGEATVTPIGGNGDYTYLWDNNETTQTALALSAGTHSVTVTDSKGCTTTCTVTITQPNILSCTISQDSTVKCFGENTGKATVTALGGNGNYTYLWDNGETTAQAIALSAGLHTVTTTDKLGYTTTCTVTISQPQNALSAIKSQTDVTCGGGNNGSATVIVSGGTAGYTYNWNTTPVQTTATANNLTSGNYTVLITDANGCSISESFTILDGDTVIPVINPLPETTTINCPAQPVFAQATATDTNGNIASLTYLDNTTPGNCAGSYTITRTWTAVDACGNISLPVSQTIVVQDTTAPTWTTQAETLDKTIECSDATALTAALALFPIASDSCDTDVTNIVKVSGPFVASANCSNAGTYTNTWTVTDDCGNVSDTFTQVITIQDTTAPTWITQAGTLDKTIECSDATALTAALALFPIASDSCDTDVTNIVKVSGQFVASANCSNAGTYINTWTVTDDCGNVSDTFTQVITIQDTTAPTWTTQAETLDKTIECSDATALTAALALFPIASDSCDTDVTNIVKVSGPFVASANCSNAGTYINTWTVTDDCGNVSDTFTQVITIQDTTAPIFTSNLPSDIEVSCDVVPEPAEMTASDNCNGDLPIVFTETKSDIVNGCTSNYTLTRIWKTSDCAGNTTSHTQIIKVKDTTPPTGTVPANVTNLASIDLIPVGSPTDIKDAADNCSPTVNIMVTDTNTPCDGNVTIITRTYTLTDCAGNKTELTQTFSVNCKVKKVIVANDDSAGPIAGVNHTTTNVLNVFSNDTLDGNAVNPSNVILTTVTPNDYLHLNPDGSIDVLPNAPVGTLTMVYQICEAAQTDNCDTATVNITIEAPKMIVTATPICVNDVPYIDYVVTPINFTPVDGVTITWADSNNNVVTTMTELPLSGRVLWPGAVVDGNGKGIDWPGWIFENNKWIQGADGFEKLRPTVNLTISLNPSETITINYPPSDPYCTSRPTFAIVANDDNPPAISVPSTATNVINVFTNDTLNNTVVNPADVTLTTVTPDPKGVLTLNADGSVTVAANAPVGTYTLTYQICEKADVGNCDTAIVTVIVQDAPAPPTPVVANDDNYNNIGCNTFGVVGNVLSNDLKGAVPATLQLVDFTLITQNGDKTNPNITIDNSGNVTISSLTPAGTYIYSYRICDKLSNQNCDTATVTIVVVPNGVTQISSEACTDDSSLINLTSLLPEGSPITGTWIDKNNSNALQGSVLNPFGLALGNYAFEYLIADEKCPRSIVLNMEVNDDCKVLACGKVLAHNAFSPNGDDKNDIFKIDNIDDTTCYPGNTVEIYNRWGILVFETTNYNNTTNFFDGTSRGRTTIKQSDGLPTGTYFYIINYKSLDGNNTIQENKLDGYLYLSR
ncbi:hypothetical protein HYN56_21855 [Flavobacterium crocinum]|uniref:Internalin Ig-like inter-repeat region domain-containing protein n=1 Tax=Flavobacterium crocinum TaxID=2183896 RepID=A0A2S1YRJ7_9FLAO|nr:gliding motility-associated C-terminal domain-containing protein [Flavobacterium crocinum]AWK06730.1 hypothetical protein HYN56_21855 [Flavobacterium crocinum]